MTKYGKVMNLDKNVRASISKLEVLAQKKKRRAAAADAKEAKGEARKVCRA